MSRVLVTGASGFVGRHAVSALVARGHEVHAVARRPGSPTGDVHWHQADLLVDRGSAARVLREGRPEILLHLAWYAEHGSFWTSPRNVDWVQASLHLLREFAATADARRVVMAGSCAEYAWTRAVYLEDAPCLPGTLYGAAKHGLRIVAEAFAGERELSFAWGRLFFLYGPGEAAGRFGAAIATALLAGDPAPMTSGTQIRDFLHVADAGDAFAALAAGRVEGAINVASGSGVSLRDLARLIARHTGGEERLQVGALPSRAGDPPSLVADVTRLRGALGWEARIALEEGIAQSVAWWRGAGAG